MPRGLGDEWGDEGHGDCFGAGEEHAEDSGEKVGENEEEGNWADAPASRQEHEEEGEGVAEHGLYLRRGLVGWWVAAAES